MRRSARAFWPSESASDRTLLLRLDKTTSCELMSYETRQRRVRRRRSQAAARRRPEPRELRVSALRAACSEALMRFSNSSITASLRLGDVRRLQRLECRARPATASPASARDVPGVVRAPGRAAAGASISPNASAASPRRPERQTLRLQVGARQRQLQNLVIERPIFCEGFAKLREQVDLLGEAEALKQGGKPIGVTLDRVRLALGVSGGLSHDLLAIGHHGAVGCPGSPDETNQQVGGQSIRLEKMRERCLRPLAAPAERDDQGAQADRRSRPGRHDLGCEKAHVFVSKAGTITAR